MGEQSPKRPLDNEEDASAGVLYPSHFPQVVEQLESWRAADEVDDDTATPGDFGSEFSVTLKELFEGSESNWVEQLRARARGSLNDELDIYDLLDLDAPGLDSDAFGSANDLESIIST